MRVVETDPWLKLCGDRVSFPPMHAKEAPNYEYRDLDKIAVKVSGNANPTGPK